MADERPFLRLFTVTGGLIAWAAQFTAIYGVAAVACARGYDRISLFGVGLVPFAILVATVLALAAAGFVTARAYRARQRLGEGSDPTERFINTTALLVGGLSLVTILWHGLPALIVPACS